MSGLVDRYDDSVTRRFPRLLRAGDPEVHFTYLYAWRINNSLCYRLLKQHFNALELSDYRLSCNDPRIFMLLFEALDEMPFGKWLDCNSIPSRHHSDLLGL